MASRWGSEKVCKKLEPQSSRVHFLKTGGTLTAKVNYCPLVAKLCIYSLMQVNLWRVLF